uniref:Uncharacterized protein n=1 Tax=Oryza brachyantha TaxID=4533 RepID=J3NBN4_ORYBR
GTRQDQQGYCCYFLHGSCDHVLCHHIHVGMQEWTECTVQEPHCTMDSCREKCKTEATSRKCNRMTAGCHKHAKPEQCCCYFYP